MMSRISQSMCYYASFNEESSRKLIEVIEQEIAHMRASWIGKVARKKVL